MLRIRPNMGLDLVRWQADAPNINGHISTLDPIAPGGTGFEACWLRPAVGGVALSSLLTWWTLLFGLSIVGTHEPAGWMRALDYDSSELAALLDRLLDIGLSRVPYLNLGGYRRHTCHGPVNEIDAVRAA